MEDIMYQIGFSFSEAPYPTDALADAFDLYTEEKGYGFVIEKNRKEQELLQIPELNSAFSPWYWDSEKELTSLMNTPLGVMVKNSSFTNENYGLPLSFKVKVPNPGNYQIRLTICCGKKGCNNLIIFTGRRHLACQGITIAPDDSYTAEFTVHLCDIIPRGKEEVYADHTLDITLFGENIALSRLSICEIEAPVIYISGDSTVTDQSGTYPYQPGCCYSGWGQMLSAYLKTGISVSNHAHSGLTTESFRNEGHYQIIRRFIKPGDYYLIQFAHNDQKLPYLDASGGYRERIIAYIEEIRHCGAIPILITPLARNTWTGQGTYNDLLVDYAAECIRVGEEYQVPVIDLHQFSMDFIKQKGLDQAKSYFYPKDYTHTNDYGAYLMAGYVASKLLGLPGLTPYKGSIPTPEWIPPIEILLPTPPESFTQATASILPAETQLDRPEEPCTRVEFLEQLVKIIGYVPVNVYNDRYSDVIGHEWYAGLVEVSYQNSLVDPVYTPNGSFYPLEPVTWEQVISFCSNGYKSRHAVAQKEDPIKLAKKLNLLPNTYQPEELVSRKESLHLLRALEKTL